MVMTNKVPLSDNCQMNGTVNIELNWSDYGHERCQAALPWIPISSDNHQSRNLAVPYLWRTLDQDGDTIDILVQKRRNKAAAKRFLTVYGVVGNLFRLARHLTRVIHYREFRTRAFCEWHEVTCAQMLAE